MEDINQKRDELGNRQRNKRIHKGWELYAKFGIVLVLLGVIILTKATITCTINANKWENLVKDNSKAKAPIPPLRGNIYSDDDVPIAISVQRYVVALDLGAEGIDQKVFDETIDDLAKGLSELIGDKSATEYKRSIEKARSQHRRYYRLVRREVSYTELQAIKEMSYFKGRPWYRTGLTTEKYVRRVLPYGNLAYRTIGRIMNEPDSTGMTHGNSGLEMKFDSLLCGTPGLKRFVRVPPSWEPVVEVPAKNGMNVYTTLNVDIQDIAEKSLRKTLVEVDADWGCAVVMDVKSGAIKALTNLDRISEGVYRESTNHALADLIEPGSTFKSISMLAVLEKEGINPEDTVDVGNGLYSVGRGLTIRDHNAHKGGYGKITYNQVIFNSSNVGTAKAVLKTFAGNEQGYLDALNKMNIFDQIDLEIPGTAKPVFQQDVSKWSKSTMPWSSYGYEILMPPIYTLRFYNAVANDGKMVEPYLVRQVSGNSEVAYERSTRVVNRKIASSKAIGQLQYMLRGVVTEGTGKAMDSPYVAIAGKTGTAQRLGGGTFSGAGHNVTFCGYFPADNPLYSCIVVVSHPRGVYPSGSIPGQVLRDIAEKTIATSYTKPLSDVAPDSMVTYNQRIASGYTESIKDVLSYTNARVDKIDKKSEWLRHEGGDSLQILTKTTPQHAIMPDLIGMSVMDAAYLAEQLGMKVAIRGTGAIVSQQSVKAGGKIMNGQHIILTLNK